MDEERIQRGSGFATLAAHLGQFAAAAAERAAQEFDR
jgi:hypothetical protein